MSENKGMSSEEVDKLTTEPDETEPESKEEPEEQSVEEPKEEPAEEQEPSEADLAKEALEVTEEPEPEVTVDPKDAVIGGMRRDLRDAERRLAVTEARLEASAKPAVQEKSPMQLAAEEQDKPIGEIIVDGKLYQEQQAWEKEQDAAATEQQKVKDFETAFTEAQRTMTDEVHGKGLGLLSLRDLGGHLLDDLDQVRIARAGKDCGKAARRILQLRIMETDGLEAVELRKRLKAKKTQTEPKTEEPEPKKKAAVPKPTNDEDRQVRASTEQIMQDLEM